MAQTDALFSNFLNTLGANSNKFSTSGGSALDTSSNFFKSLLGDRSSIMRAISPATDAVRASADTAQKEQAQKGTARTGGTADVNQQVEDEVRKQIGSLIGQVQTTAASNLSSIGESEVNSMLQALGIGTQATQADIASRRQASAEMWGSLIGGIASVATAPFNKAGDTLLGKAIGAL